MSIEEYQSRQLELLSKQHQIDIEETDAVVARLTKSQLQEAGLAILGVYPVEYKTCFGGRIAIDFSGDSNEKLRKSAIKTGDVVSVEGANIEEGTVTGTVHKMTDSTVTVIFDSDPDLQGPVRLVKRGNPVVFERMRKAIKSINGDHPIVRLFFDPQPTNSPGYCNHLINVDSGICGDLNGEQQEAVKCAINATNLSIIHGPPGTGKTQCIAKIVKLLSQKRILLAAASNLAVDNMVERIGEDGNVIRIGHPARLTEAVLRHSLDVRLADSDQGTIVREIRRDIERQLQKLKTTKKGKKDVYRELKELRFELRKREEKRLDELMTNRSIVVATTLNGAAGKIVTKYAPYDVCIIDEASQALQAETWMAALLAPKLIIVGDHHQLPPTTDVAGLKETMFDVLIRKYNGAAVMLKRQYRMHEDIMRWSNKRFYNQQLVADDSVQGRVLTDQDGEDMSAVMFIDTAGEAMWEQKDTVSGSHWNEHEAALVVKHAQTIIESCNNIAIITPYSAQVDCISRLLSEQNSHDHQLAKILQVGTVDGFQGREADAVILSMVRSNQDRQIGFLAEARRLNVAVTRARRHLCVVGDSDTMKVEYEDFVKWLEEVALVCAPE